MYKRSTLAVEIESVIIMIGPVIGYTAIQSMGKRSRYIDILLFLHEQIIQRTPDKRTMG